MKKLVIILALFAGGTAHADNWLTIDFKTKSCPQLTDDSGTAITPAEMYKDLISQYNSVPDVVFYQHMGVKVVQITATADGLKKVLFYTDDAGTCADTLENNPNGPPDLTGITDSVAGGSISLGDLN